MVAGALTESGRELINRETRYAAWWAAQEGRCSNP